MELSFPVSEPSLVGYTAFHKRVMALDNVRDQSELASYTGLNYGSRYEDRTGVRVTSIISVSMMENEEKFTGIIQLINTNRPVADYLDEIELLEHLCMRTLKMDGIRRVVSGRTTLAEVLKVCID